MAKVIFYPRNSAPLKTNKYYGRPDPYISAGLGMFQLSGNCTDYAWCRYREAQQDMNASNKLPTTAASIFYKRAVEKKLKTGKEPKIGSIACFEGHLAFVEGITGDKVKYSASGWAKVKAARYLFKTKTIKKGGAWNGKKLQGYIYPEVEFQEDLPVKGNYEVVSPRYVRKGAGTEYDIKKVKELTKDGQAHCTNPKPNAKAQYKSGTIFTNQGSVKASNGSIWAKTPSGYVCLVSSKGTIYCKKA